MTALRTTLTRRTASAAIALILSVSLVGAQTRITAPPNKYSVAEDVQLGRDAAQEARRQLPILDDDFVTSYVERIGQRLVSAIPEDLRHREFRYTFDVVNVREINAFALPGGPMFVNRGMIEAARTEGEVAGVMAHELSHVALRHGTAQASKATKYQIGELLGAIGGAIIGGTLGQVVAQGTSFGLGTAFMRFSREFERQADIEGVQIMARAGYDPRDMANMFKTIEKQGRSGGPEWMSDHPNPGNRVEYITREAQLLRVENAVRDTQDFSRVKARLASMAKAPTTEEATRNRQRRTTTSRGESSRPPTGVVSRPSSQYRQYNEGDLFRVSVPANWRELPSNDTVTFAPDGAYGDYNGTSVFTHGIEIGVARNERHDLQTATDELIDSLSRNNPQLDRRSGYQRTSISGRDAVHTILTNVSEVTRENETIQLVTAFTRDGNLLYTIAVAPSDEFRDYQQHFQRVVGSIRLMN
jgi:Zn-dependent protease with chaperone function